MVIEYFDCREKEILAFEMQVQFDLKPNVFQASHIQSVYDTLSKIENIVVYKKQDIPDSLNYKNNVRIGDIVLVSQPGYAIYVKKQEIDWSVNSELTECSIVEIEIGQTFVYNLTLFS
jgi:hypothetical protein